MSLLKHSGMLQMLQLKPGGRMKTRKLISNQSGKSQKTLKSHLRKLLK